MPSTRGWVEAALPAACAALPACLAAAHLGNGAEAADDRAVARVLGWDPQPWRALDVVVGSVFAPAPLGNLVARAALGPVALLAVTSAVVYWLTRDLLGKCAPATRLGATGAAIAALWTGFAPSMQREATVPGGTVTGALLVLAPLALLAAAGERSPAHAASDGSVASTQDDARSAAAVVATLALALGYEPLVGGCALASIVAFALTSPGARDLLRRGSGARPGALLLAAAGGLLPFAVALARTRAHGGAALPALAGAWAGDGASSRGFAPLPYADFGTALPVLAVGGTVLALLVERARPLAAALLAVVVAGLACGWIGAPHAPLRFGAPVLAAFAGACVLAGVALQAIARWVADSRLPFSRASAAMVILLELVVPVDEADESLAQGSSTARAQAEALWDVAAWGVLPPRSVVVVADARLYQRALAARALGTLRGDIAVVPAPAIVAAQRARPAFGSDASLVPLWRDLELTGQPSEASLSALALVRPVAMAYEPRWGRAVGRHLLPLALLDRFEPEPRGSSDRRRALDGFAPLRDRLARLVAGAGRTTKDGVLAEASAYPLRARLLEVASSADRDLVGRALEDVHAFAPDDPVAAQVVARMALGRGAPRLDDLRP